VVTRPAAIAAAATTLLGCSSSPGRDDAADLVLRGAAVYTAAPSRVPATAIAIREGRLVYIGPDSGVAGLIGRATRVLDLPGRMILPGFHDSHVHPVSSGIELGECNLSELAPLRALTDSIASCARATRGPWVRGAGWALPLFPAANPSRALLDSLVPDRPAYFTAADGHSAWVNSRALTAAGISRTTPDPPGGRIERDRRGEPSGTLRESAIELAATALPPYSREDHIAGLRRALARAARLGITSMYEASAREPELEAYAALDGTGELTARIVAAQYVDDKAGPAQVAELAARRERYRGTRYFRPIGAKIFADGVIEAETAALLEPYVGRGTTRGPANLEPEPFARLATALDSAGFELHIHAIGDRAVRWSLDALERAAERNGPRDRRPQIAHLEMIDPADIPRFERLGVAADFQPLWAFADRYIVDLTIPKLGPERSRRLYPIGSVARTGAVVVGGSDWPVSSLNPMDAIQVGATRIDPAAARGRPFIPEERIGLDTLLQAYTANGAYVMHQERETGTLEVGKAADIVVLERDLRAIPPSEIHTVRVLLTLLDGREIYRSPELPVERLVGADGEPEPGADERKP
jgi:predicted amidohydrolase YtcJ